MLLLDLLRCSKYTFTYVDLLQEYIDSRKQMRSHAAVNKYTYVSI